MIGIERTDSVRELAEIYSMADVFVNPTYEDNYPTTNLEALSCGTPVVTYRTGGSVEAVEESGAGAVVEQGNVNQLSQAIEKECGNHKYKIDFDCGEERTNKKYVNLYNKILLAGIR